MQKDIIGIQLYKKKFLQNEKITFPHLTHSGDIFFNIATLAMAKHIAYVDKKLFHYRRLKPEQKWKEENDFKASFIALKKAAIFLKRHNWTLAHF